MLRPLRQAILAAGLLTALSPQIAQAQQGLSGPPAVTVITVETQNVAPRYEFIGRIEAVQSVDLRARVDGFIQDVTVEDGQPVTRGDILFKIEPNRYEASVAAAQADLARAEADRELAQLEFRRADELRTRGTGSQQNLDVARAALKGAEADVLAAQSALRSAQIDLADTQIKSPIDGRIGRTYITAGNYVNATSGALAQVVQLNPIRAVFSVSERDYLDTIQAYSGQTADEINANFIPRIRLPNGELYPETGIIEFVDNRIDPTTGTIAIRALFANPRGIVLPGQFVSVLIDEGEEINRAVVPYQAVQQDRQGRFVLVVGDDDTVSVRRVEIGANTGDGWAILDGLTGGEIIIVSGFQKAKEGQPVNPVWENQS
ncbi:MAG: efflux RND transporter periplasmic adaptor subunit [Alphaproteobacteria bacterium]|nr:efflux RND transporter periplasmic adaptor subunit [Alphaproteobacteria bacterium]